MDETYTKFCRMFPVLEGNLEFAISQQDAELVITELRSLDILDVAIDQVRLQCEQILRSQVVPKFWSYFRTKEENMNFIAFESAVNELHQQYTGFVQIMKQLESFKMVAGIAKASQDEKNGFDLSFKCTLLSQLPVDFEKLVDLFYGKSFCVFAVLAEDHEEELEESLSFCKACEMPSSNCKCTELVETFRKTNSKLLEMGILDRIAGYTLTKLIQEQIDKHVKDFCTGRYDESHISNLENWLNTAVLDWLTKIYNNGSLDMSNTEQKTKDAINNFQLKLNYYLFEVYANIIIEQFFNIIIEFPDSQAAIDDLKICLDKLNLKGHLIRTIKNSLETRLLHPGVDTADILTGYVAAIKTLKHLDKTGVLLQTVIEPVKEYLRNRQDTVRCVVSGLIDDEGPTDLADELARSETLKTEDTIALDDMTNWEKWKPDDIETESSAHQISEGKNRPSDIISMVVDIYGTKELFVIEYRNLLAERLLSQLEFNPEKEIRNLELLKLRFGEALLHSCEVMLKDITDSKRINAHIQSDQNFTNANEFDISALILSSQFWPAFKKDTMELPEAIKNQFDRYTKQYEGYKGNRTLCWNPLNGKVNIEIEHAGKTLEMTVTPPQATIILHFETQREWTLEKLSSTMNVPQSILRKRIVFWQSQGLIRETRDGVFVLVEGDTVAESNQAHDICEDDEAESAMASASDQREEELQVFWSYIVGMLTNLDSLPLERIHQMLKMFASQGPGFEFSQEELKNFLQRKVREHKLVYAGAVYQLPKT
ncbi:anaphase-promoting complex subunit 2 [Culicoides brevitarsis]|uniref:anaphase-promoting complex subunit 2 n=1 Tax=Culicoides brevitarsis TaxID=469753 RepID=UPI00307C0690